jgi:hypothetical protein
LSQAGVQLPCLPAISKPPFLLWLGGASFVVVCSPHTLRAKYGLSSAFPAIHCTDLAEDGPLEAEYLFVLLEQ